MLILKSQKPLFRIGKACGGRASGHRRKDLLKTRVSIIAWTDGSSHHLWATPVFLGPGQGITRQDVAGSFHDMLSCPHGGMPREILIDNGSEFAALLEQAVEEREITVTLTEEEAVMVQAAAEEVPSLLHHAGAVFRLLWSIEAGGCAQGHPGIVSLYELCARAFEGAAGREGGPSPLSTGGFAVRLRCFAKNSAWNRSRQNCGGTAQAGPRATQASRNPMTTEPDAMTLTRSQLALLRVAAKDRGLSDDAYRSALTQIGGVTTAKDPHRDGYDAMMGYFDYLGFTPVAAKGTNFGAREGMASFAQLELIRSLWSEITRRACPDETAFDKWLLAKFKVSALRFLKKDTAEKVITALMAWKKRLRDQSQKAA